MICSSCGLPKQAVMSTEPTKQYACGNRNCALFLDHDDNSEDHKKWTNRKLKKEAKSYHYGINVVDCFNAKDVLFLEMILRELERRGIESVDEVELTFSDDEE